MSSLQQSIDARRAAEKAEPTCHAIRSNATWVDFHVSPHSRCGFPVGQLCHYTLEANDGGGDEPPERLTLAFPTADVVLLGARLARLVELLHDHSLGAVTPLDARYSNALGKAPWVARIVVSRIDKSTGAPG